MKSSQKMKFQFLLLALIAKLFKFEAINSSSKFANVCAWNFIKKNLCVFEWNWHSSNRGHVQPKPSTATRVLGQISWRDFFAALILSARIARINASRALFTSTARNDVFSKIILTACWILFGLLNSNLRFSGRVRDPDYREKNQDDRNQRFFEFLPKIRKKAFF